MDDYYQSEGFGGQLIQYAEAPARRPFAVLIPMLLVVATAVCDLNQIVGVGFVGDKFHGFLMTATGFETIGP